MKSIFALIALSLCACAAPVEAPKDLNGLARFFFDDFDPKNGDGTEADPATSDVELQDAFVKLHAAISGDTLSDPVKGTLDNITQAELDAVGLSSMDPSVPQGMFTESIVHCTLDQLESFVLNPDQLSLYPEAYASYARTFDKDRPDNLPTWQLTYTSAENALVTNQFTATVDSGLRKVPATDGAAFGRTLVRRGFLPSPATFENPGAEFTHDFQVETYHERKPGEIVHFYAMWRFMHLGVLGNSYDGIFIDQTTGGMIDWDTKTDALCAQ